MAFNSIQLNFISDPVTVCSSVHLRCYNKHEQNGMQDHLLVWT